MRAHEPGIEPDFTEWVDLASERLGGVVLAANDDFFAAKENLIKDGPPVWREGEYTDRGKWMDGWETRRRRDPGHDWCVLRLGASGVVLGAVVDTRHFRGNAPEACAVEACETDPSATPADLERGPAWFDLVPRAALRPDAENRFEISERRRVTHVRLRIYPDGGVARLRLYGVGVPDWDALARRGSEIDLAAAENGGAVLAASDMFFGSRHNLILPGDPIGMRDGWETRRRRGPGHDWTILHLGRPGVLRRACVDTRFFKGNAPGSCSIEVCEAEGATVASLTGGGISWKELLPKTPLTPDTLHEFDDLRPCGRVTDARLNIYPDGGVARVRLFGTVGPERP